MLVKVAFPRPPRRKKTWVYHLPREQNTNRNPHIWVETCKKSLPEKKVSWSLTWRLGLDHWISFFFASYTVWIIIAHYHMFKKVQPLTRRILQSWCGVMTAVILEPFDGPCFDWMKWPYFWKGKDLPKIDVILFSMYTLTSQRNVILSTHRISCTCNFLLFSQGKPLVLTSFIHLILPWYE